MLYKKNGYPGEGEIVLCTVKKILPTSVFVSVDEYKNKEGIIHISEIAPGRIRTIRDYVKEGKTIFCKTLRVNTQRGTLDLSLRRVTKSAYINKNQEIKQEQKAEKVLEVFAQQLKKSVDDVYKKIGLKIIEEYGSLNACFAEVLTEGEKILTRMGIEKAWANNLTQLIQTCMKPPEVKMAWKISLKSKAPDGIEIIKKSIKKALEFAKTKKYKVEINYSGAPKYNLIMKAPEYKIAEKQLEEVANVMITTIEKEGGEGETSKK